MARKKKDPIWPNLAWALAGATVGTALYLLLKPEIKKMFPAEVTYPYPVTQPKVSEGSELLRWNTEYFAAKLAAGNVTAPPATLWWPRHSTSVSWYLAARSLDDGSADQARKEVDEACDEWTRGVMKMRKGAKKGALMKEHAFLECALVDAALANDPGLVGEVGTLLNENIRNQALLYGTMFEGFPEEEFKSLMAQHVGVFAKETGCRMGNKPVAADECLKSLMGNSVSLAALITEWF